jgi:hypothetical protein
MRAIRFGVIAVAVCGLATAAWAETLSMTGTFPAPSREAAMLRSIAVERLSGADGAQVGATIERALSRQNGNGIAYFDVYYAGRRSGGRADGTLSGSVTSGVEDSTYKQNDKRCVEKDKDGKCTKEETVQIPCTLRVANLTADIRIVRNGDGRIVYSAARPLRREVRWCKGQNPPATAEEMIGQMVNDVGETLRADTIPATSTYRIRILESDKGVPRELNRRFKDAIKLTQRNPSQACQEWTALNGAIPNNGAITFNVGLCAEWAGDLKGAERWYRAAGPLLGRGNDASEGVSRVTRRMIADSDLAARRSRR